MSDIRLRPIGTVVSSATEAVDFGWGRVVSRIRLVPELAAGLAGLEGFSHADVKPHARVFDAPQAVREPEWIARLMQGYF